jgi:hypothetical protein
LLRTSSQAMTLLTLLQRSLVFLPHGKYIGRWADAGIRAKVAELLEEVHVRFDIEIDISRLEERLKSNEELKHVDCTIKRRTPEEMKALQNICSLVSKGYAARKGESEESRAKRHEIFLSRSENSMRSRMTRVMELSRNETRRGKRRPTKETRRKGRGSQTKRTRHLRKELPSERLRRTRKPKRSKSGSLERMMRTWHKGSPPRRLKNPNPLRLGTPLKLRSGSRDSRDSRERLRKTGRQDWPKRKQTKTRRPGSTETKGRQRRTWLAGSKCFPGSYSLRAEKS